MPDSRVIEIINAIRCCHLCDDCKLNCQECIYNYTEEELQTALDIATKAIKERLNGLDS